jgi:hypothetical protein
MLAYIIPITGDKPEGPGTPGGPGGPVINPKPPGPGGPGEGRPPGTLPPGWAEVWPPLPPDTGEGGEEPPMIWPPIKPERPGGGGGGKPPTAGAGVPGIRPPIQGMPPLTPPSQLPGWILVYVPGGGFAWYNVAGLVKAIISAKPPVEGEGGEEAQPK